MVAPLTSQSTVTTTKVPVAWSAADGGSGVQSYDVRARSASWNGGLRVVRDLEVGHDDDVVDVFLGSRANGVPLRASADNAGNVSSWSVDRCTSVPLDDGSLTAASFVRTTNVAGAYSKTLSTATNKGASLTRTSVRARSVSLVARTCAACGSVAVRWNGKTIKSVSLAAATATRVLPVLKFTKPTSGTLQVVVTSSKKKVAIDAVGVSDPPLSGSITIKAGASYANNPLLTITASVSGANGATGMRLTNGGVAGGAWVPFAGNTPFSLTALDGARLVAAQFRDAAGNMSAVALDDITLDRVAPALDVSTGSFSVASGTGADISANVGDASPLQSVTLETSPVGDPTVTDAAMTLSGGVFKATVANVTAAFDYSVIATDKAGNATTAPSVDRFHVTVGAPPSSQKLIADTLAAGTIDYPTSLEYRMWALFGDPQLPDAYVGSGSMGEDEDLFLELRDGYAGLPSAAQAELARYLVRPDDPASPLNSTAPVAPTRGSGRSAEVAAPVPDKCPGGGGWFFLERQHFRVSSCGVDDALSCSTVLTHLENLYGPMTQAEPAGLGTPISDGPGTNGLGKNNGGNALIDVYIVTAPQCVNRGGGCHGVPRHNAAVAVPVDPFTTVGPRESSSGFIVIDRARVACRRPLHRIWRTSSSTSSSSRTT